MDEKVLVKWHDAKFHSSDVNSPITRPLILWIILLKGVVSRGYERGITFGMLKNLPVPSTLAK